LTIELEGLRRDKYYCGRDARVPKENTFAPLGLWGKGVHVPGACAARWVAFVRIANSQCKGGKRFLFNPYGVG